jgi:hypothetical protein
VVNFRLKGPVPSPIIPEKEPGQEVPHRLGQLQRRRPEWKFQPMGAPSTLLSTVMSTLAGPQFKILINSGSLRLL